MKPNLLITKFRNTSIVKKFWGTTILLLVAMLISSIYIYTHSYDMLYHNYTIYAKEDFSNTYNSLNKFEERMLHLVSLFQANKPVSDLLCDIPSYSVNHFQSYLQARQTLLPLLYTMEDGSNDYFCRLYINSTLDINDITSRLLPLSNVTDTPWACEVMTGWGQWHYYAAQTLKSNCPALIAPIRNLEDYTELTALLRIDLNHDFLINELKPLQSADYTTAFLQTTDGQLIALTGNELPKDFTLDVPLNTLEGFQSELLNQQKIGKDTVFYRTLPNSQWRLVMVVHHDLLFSSLYPQLSTLILIGFLLTLVGVFCAMPTLFFTISRIRRFHQYEQHYSSNTLSEIPPHLEPICMDEIGQLIISHNALLDRIEQLMNDREQREQKLHKLEINGLQAQIKPHFLYNTLEAITWMAKMNQPDKVEKTIFSLTKFYRLCLSHGVDILPVSQELKIIENYFEIQNMRYEQRFTLEIDVPDNMMTLKLPKITLQPLVENALVHGILESGEKEGCVRIFGRRKEHCYELCIADSGAHFTTPQWNCVLHKSSPDAKYGTGEGYGLSNVERRLDLFFHTEQCMYLDETQAGWTCIVIPFPIMTIS